jgi:hypothetical protein
MSTPEVSGASRTTSLLSVIERAMEALDSEIDRYLDEMLKKADRPQVLLHFKDCAGLIGILQTHALWASLATALNDASETTLASELLAFGGPMAITRSRHLPHDFLERVSKGALRLKDDDRSTDYRTYVSSLCAQDVGVHWMQYGHRGTGVALEFDASMLASLPQFRLCKVVYDTNEQFSRIRDLIGIVDKFLDSCLPNAAPGQEAEAIKITAAALLHSFIKMIAPQMKSVVFSAEDEWRLFSSEMRAKPNSTSELTRPTKFRTAESRLVPYKELRLPAGSIKGIKLGYSCSLRHDEQALRVLMD